MEDFDTPVTELFRQMVLPFASRREEGMDGNIPSKKIFWKIKDTVLIPSHKEKKTFLFAVAPISTRENLWVR